MELLYEAWDTFLANDPVALVIVTAVFAWLAIKSTRDMNAPVRDWDQLPNPHGQSHGKGVQARGKVKPNPPAPVPPMAHPMRRRRRRR